MRVKVTEEDIQRARRKDSYRCVVVQAIARTIPDATRIEVDSQTIRYTDRDGKRLRYLTPFRVESYVIAFDAGDDLEPFSFDLRDPIEFVRHERTPEAKAAHAEREKKRKARRKELDELAKTRQMTIDDPPAIAAALPPETVDPETGLYNPEPAAPAAPAAKDERVKTGNGRRAPKRVFKSGVRSYGHRVMRINQEKDGGADSLVEASQ